MWARRLTKLWIKNDSRKRTINENKKEKKPSLRSLSVVVKEKCYRSQWQRPQLVMGPSCVPETHYNDRAKMLPPVAGSLTMSEPRQESDLLPGKWDSSDVHNLSGSRTVTWLCVTQPRMLPPSLSSSLHYSGLNLYCGLEIHSHISGSLAILFYKAFPIILSFLIPF